MKILLLYYVVFLMGVSADITTLSLQHVVEDCKNNSGVDQVLIDQAQNGKFADGDDDEKLSSYYRCFGDPIGHIAYLENRPTERTYADGVPYYHAHYWDLIPSRLRDWLVKKLKHSPETVDDVLQSCVSDKKKMNRMKLSAQQIFEFSKCFSEKGIPVDAVSANYVDRSVEDFNELHDLCKENYGGVDQNLIDEAQNGNVDVNSKNLGTYYTCYFLNSGILNMYGYIPYNYLKNWFKLMLKQESDQVIVSALHRCYKSRLQNIVEEVLEIVKCFADEKLPVDVMANQ